MALDGIRYFLCCGLPSFPTGAMIFHELLLGHYGAAVSLGVKRRRGKDLTTQVHSGPSGMFRVISYFLAYVLTFFGVVPSGFG